MERATKSEIVAALTDVVGEASDVDDVMDALADAGLRVVHVSPVVRQVGEDDPTAEHEAPTFETADPGAIVAGTLV